MMGMVSALTLEQLARDASLLGPIVLLAEPGAHGLTRARAVLRRHRLAVLEFDDPRRAASYAAARETPLIVVAPNTPSWAMGAVASLRGASGAPLVAAGLTPSSDELIELLDAGASIVVDASADERELTARLASLYAVVRREAGPSTRWLEAAGLRVDLFTRACTIASGEVQLSRYEYRLLVFLMSRAQQTLGQDEIVRQVWRWNAVDGINTLRIHVGRLRRKLGDDSRAPEFLGSVRGAGYCFLKPVAEVGDDADKASATQREAISAARLRGIYSVVDIAQAAGDVRDLATRATDLVVGTSQCDAASMFRHEADTRRSSLVASTGTSGTWDRAMRDGHVLDTTFIGGQAAAKGSVVQVADLRRAAKRYPASATLMNADQIRSCLVVPIVVKGEVWGDIGFANRQPRAFTPGQTTFLRSVTDLVALRIAAGLAA
jgi:DNA-binding response OmpR family regulator